MGYRIGGHKPPKPKRELKDTATPSNIFIINGENSRLAIPCWYLMIDPPVVARPHSRMHHDHVGWPSPTHPDHICQSWDFAHSCCGKDHSKHDCGHCHDYIDMSKLVPIHLREEGYTTVSIAFGDNVEGLSAHCHIDEQDDWIIRVELRARCDDATEEKVRTRFTIFVSDDDTMKDVVATGYLTILPGPYVQGE